MKNPSVLLVEDEQLLRVSLELNMRRQGINVVTAENGTEALSMLQRYSYDLLITDYLMEGLTGTELMQKVRKQFPGIKVIVMSGYADEEIKTEILQAGADKFLWKPVGLKAMIEAIEEVFKN